jgi:hypothetical protein
MEKVTSLFVRSYNSKVGINTLDGTIPIYIPSDEDTIYEDLKRECIDLQIESGNIHPNDGKFYWPEGNSQTHITVIKKIIIRPQYHKIAILQTIGSDNHPQGLIAILRKHKFKEKDMTYLSRRIIWLPKKEY